jgi:hypothetical protein
VIDILLLDKARDNELNISTIQKVSTVQRGHIVTDRRSVDWNDGCFPVEA